MASSNQSEHNSNPVLLQANTSSQLSASSPIPERSQLGADFQPSDFSVICGRGKAIFDHPGNYRLRMLTSAFVADYSQAGRKLEKSTIVASIVAGIRLEGGCFCRYEEGKWCEIGNYSAREKVSAMFRDLLYTQYRSSTKAKIARRRAQDTGHSDNSPMSSPRSGSSTDSLGFDPSLEVPFFDIDTLFYN
jgi:hypothetical protein